MKDYSDLPEYMTLKEIESEIVILLSQVKAGDAATLQAANGLVELVYRQSNTRQQFNHSTKQLIEDWVVRAWTEKDLQLADALCTVIANLDTPNLRRLVESAVKSKNKAISKMASETLKDMPLMV